MPPADGDSSVLSPLTAATDPGAQAPPVTQRAPVVCHCRQVSHETVEEAIDAGRAASLADLQRQTAACTRCFGCRFELEAMLEDRLGPGYDRTDVVTLPVEEPPPAPRRLDGLRRLLGRGPTPAPAAGPLPRRMYMPVLDGFAGHDVRTRVILFNSFDERDAGGGRRPDVSLRADLLAPDGTRLSATQVNVKPQHSAVLDTREMMPAGGLLAGLGAVKRVADAAQRGSFRPYFHLISPGGITSTHEKAAPRPSKLGTPGLRSYFWLVPVGYTRRPEHSYVFLTATQPEPLDRHELVWQPESGEEVRSPMPRLELDQSACIPLHELFPAVGRGDRGGTVRIEPNQGVPAGFMIRLDPERETWRIQHL